MLEIQGLMKSFQGVHALEDVSLAIEPGEVVGLIGPNGSGKTTLFNCLTGFVRPEAGTVRFQGHNISGLPPFRVSRLGLARTFQSVRLFGKLSATENLVAAVQEYSGESSLSRLLRTPVVRRHERGARLRALSLLDRIGLAPHAGSAAEDLSYGQRKLLSIAMAIMSRPTLLLLDEPTSAVSAGAITVMRDWLRELNDNGQTILVIEHNMQFVMGLSNRVIVLDAGKKIAEGAPAAIRANAEVLKAYLGG
jgi:branched-chain amino acid transport system ATP-binding protein